MISNPENYIKLVTDELNRFTLNVQTLASQNLLDNNIIAENIFRDLLNRIYGWKLVNENFRIPNAKAIDLGDVQNKIAVQVTSDHKRTKIEKTIREFERDDVDEVILTLVKD